MLPEDFQTAHFNAAPEPLISAERLTGHERVVVTNACPTRNLEFELPGLQNPECLIGISGASDRTVACELDTVIVNLDDMQLTLLWRTVVELRDGPLDLQSLRVHCANAPPRPSAPRMPDNLVPLFPDQASNGATGA